MSRYPYPWHYNVVLSTGFVVLSAFAPETFSGRVSQFALLALAVFATWQAGIIKEHTRPWVTSLMSPMLMIFFGVVYILFAVTSESFAMQVLFGVIAIAAFGLAGSLWQARRSRARSDKSV